MHRQGNAYTHLAHTHTHTRPDGNAADARYATSKMQCGNCYCQGMQPINVSFAEPPKIWRTKEEQTTDSTGLLAYIEQLLLQLKVATRYTHKPSHSD